METNTHTHAKERDKTMELTQYKFNKRKEKYTGRFLSLFSLFRALRFTSRCEAHTNFADESICLMADNVWN
jgi:hypothetical protein